MLVIILKINVDINIIRSRNRLPFVSRNESGRFGALKSDSTHHFFRNACTKSGSLRFSQFSGCWLILCLYTYDFWLSLCKIVRSSVILLLPLFTPNFWWSLCCSFFKNSFWLYCFCLLVFVLSLVWPMLSIALFFRLGFL
jgi:hypothetical protein